MLRNVFQVNLHVALRPMRKELRNVAEKYRRVNAVACMPRVDFSAAKGHIAAKDAAHAESKNRRALCRVRRLPSASHQCPDARHRHSADRVSHHRDAQLGDAVSRRCVRRGMAGYAGRAAVLGDDVVVLDAGPRADASDGRMVRGVFPSRLDCSDVVRHCDLNF